MTRRVSQLLVALCFVLLVGCVRPGSEEGLAPPKEANGQKSLNSAVPTEIRFVNHSGQTVNVYWLDYEGRPKWYQTLRDGEFYDQPTYVTHPWLIAGENGDVWDVHQPAEQPRTITITGPKKE
jgi:von Hippel-Lindau disease tumor supressor